HELARADSRDPSRRAEQRERDLARDHVDRVAVRERDDDVGVAAARALDHVGVRGVADDGAHVEPILELAQHVGILVDDRDFVGFLAREAEGCGAADLAGTEDEYLHGTALLGASFMDRKAVYQAAFVARQRPRGAECGRAQSAAYGDTVRRGTARFLLAFAAGAVAGVASGQASVAPVIVHEWGTFTSLQDESGRAIGGINTDDEPVPGFVHRLSSSLLQSPTEVPPIFFQGAQACHPDVTMRLETPVLYFHLPPGRNALHRVNVTAQFRGGWLTEFYPAALADAPGVQDRARSFGPLRADTVGTLAWRNLDVGDVGLGPQTNEHVWTSPRDVTSASV